MPTKAPDELKPAGRRLWRAVLRDFELGEHEKAVLLEAARTVDLIDELQAVVTEEGVTAPSSQGIRAHPALVEARQQRLTLAKLLASLRIPLDDEQQTGRLPQRRSGVRPASMSVAR